MYFSNIPERNIDTYELEPPSSPDAHGEAIAWQVDIGGRTTYLAIIYLHVYMYYHTVYVRFAQARLT